MVTRQHKLKIEVIMSQQQSPTISKVNGSVLTPSKSDNCLLAIPKKGRLYKKCLEILHGIGLEFSRPNRLDYAHCKHIGITLIFLPAHDIPHYIGNGHVDMGITGQDMVRETQADVDTQMLLGFGKCKLCLLGPEKKISELKKTTVAGKRIVTSFPNVTKEYFKDLEPSPKIQYVSGSVEVACALGLADAVVDLVETGTTMRAAGLDIIEKMMDTQCVLISNTKTKHQAMIKKLKARLDGYLTAQKFILMVYNMPKDRLKEAIAITPGKRSPSLMSLEDDKWVAVNVLVLKSQASNIMDKLEAVGATDILCTSLMNCRV